MQKLKNLRKARGMTVRDLALASGVAASTISKAETGGRKPQGKTLEALAEALGVSAEELRKPIPNEAVPLSPVPPEQQEEEERAAVVSALWLLMKDLPEETLGDVRNEIENELARRAWAEIYGEERRETVNA